MLKQRKQPNALLRKARKSKGLTQAQLAAEIDVDEKTISRWESGEYTPQPVFWKKVCDFFEETPEELGFADLGVAQQFEENRLANLEAEQRAPLEERNETSLEDTEALPLSENPSSEGHLPFSSMQHPDPSSAKQKISPAHGESSSRVNVMIHHLKMAPLFWFLLLGVLVLLGVFVLPRVPFGPPNSYPNTPYPATPSTTSPSTLHRVFQNCLLDSNTAGYVKVVTKQNGKEEVACFSGMGSLSVSLDFVRRVEVGLFFAQWTYLDLAGKRHLTPMSAAPDLYWCPKSLPRNYDSSIHILQITVAPPSPETKCTGHL